jgi:cell volume regulation protein A
VVVGFAVVGMLNRVQMPDGLHPLFVVASAISIYATTSLLGGSGLLAVYLAGLVMANRPVRAYPSIVGFHDAAMWFSQIVMFLVLGLLVTPSTLVEYVVPGVIIGLSLIFVARPLAVWLCLSPFRFSEKEKLFVSWVGLRGAVSIFLAAIPTLAAVPHAEVYFNIAFFVVMISLLVQGRSLNGVARRLGLALRRSARTVRRFEVDIPGQTEQEMIGYPVAPDSLIMGLTHVPAWARIVLIVRDGDIVDPAEAGPLADGDYVYLLATPEDVPRLDRLFSESPDVARRKTPLFGELPINGDAGIGDIAALYDIDVSEEGGAMSVAEYFSTHLRNAPLPGARLPLGNATLVVREVADGAVVRAGLQLEELVDALLARSLAYTEPREKARIVRDRFAGLLARLHDRVRRR